MTPTKCVWLQQWVLSYSWLSFSQNRTASCEWENDWHAESTSKAFWLTKQRIWSQFMDTVYFTAYIHQGCHRDCVISQDIYFSDTFLGLGSFSACHSIKKSLTAPLYPPLQLRVLSLPSPNDKTNIITTCYVQIKKPFMGIEICATDFTHWYTSGSELTAKYYFGNLFSCSISCGQYIHTGIKTN